MNKLLSAILGIPRTLWFNFRFLPFNQAVVLPILLSSNTRVKKCYRGCIKLSFNQSIRPFMIKIGFHNVEPIDTYSIHTILEVNKFGKLFFTGDAHIGKGAIIHVGNSATLTLGKNFAISGTTSIVCKNFITIGNDVQFSYSGLVIDSDAHRIYDNNGILMKNNAPINIGSNVWIAPNVTIQKGSRIPNNCVIASNSLVNKEFVKAGFIIGGIPAKELKQISRWEI